MFVLLKGIIFSNYMLTYTKFLQNRITLFFFLSPLMWIKFPAVSPPHQIPCTITDRPPCLTVGNTLDHSVFLLAFVSQTFSSCPYIFKFGLVSPQYILLLFQCFNTIFCLFNFRNRVYFMTRHTLKASDLSRGEMFACSVNGGEIRRCIGIACFPK